MARLELMNAGVRPMAMAYNGSVQDFGSDWGARGLSPRIPPGLSEFPKILDAPLTTQWKIQREGREYNGTN